MQFVQIFHNFLLNCALQICEARITFPPGAGTSPEAQDLVRGCLCLSPGARLRLEDVLSHQWMTR